MDAEYLRSLAQQFEAKLFENDQKAAFAAQAAGIPYTTIRPAIFSASLLAAAGAAAEVPSPDRNSAAVAPR
jgi:uncharacterized protein YbjT (DUF2867 family)